MVPVLVTSLRVALYGIVPVAPMTPKMHRKIPGHPHKTTAAMVAIMPVVLLSILHSSLRAI